MPGAGRLIAISMKMLWITCHLKWIFFKITEIISMSIQLTQT